MKTLDVELMEVAFAGTRKKIEDFRGAKTRGSEHEYEVLDRNFQSRNAWRFVVFVPDEWRKGTYISVRPLTVPNRKIWAGLERRSILVAPCTRQGYRGKGYAQVSVSDLTGEKTRQVLNNDDPRPEGLEWFKLRAKERVATSRSSDGHHLTAVFDSDDFSGMVRLFVASRAWTLIEGFSRDDAIQARKLANERALRARQQLKGLELSMTGFLGMGTRQEVARFLKSRGAVVRTRPTSHTKFLIEGVHPLGDARLKVKSAESLGVVRISEARFRRKFSV
jgi:hypothetical protein